MFPLLIKGNKTQFRGIVSERLIKAHVRAYDRKGPKGQVEHVKEHEDSRRHAEKLLAHLEGLSGVVDAIKTAHEHAAKQKVSVAPSKQTTEPEQPPPHGPQGSGPQPPHGPIKPNPAVPRALVRAFMDLRNGTTLNQIMVDYRNEWSSAERATVDAWLARMNHPLAQKEGAPSQRFHALLLELMNRRKEKAKQGDMGNHISEQDTRSPAQKHGNVMGNVTGDSSSEKQKPQQNQGSNFSGKLDQLPDGASFVIPMKGSSYSGTWQKVTVGDETYWKKKGSTVYRPSAEFARFQPSIEKQLAAGPQAKPGKSAPLVSRTDTLSTKQAETTPEEHHTAIPHEQRGNAATVHTERGTEVNTHYAVVNAADLIPSHDIDLRPNPQFPATLQPRDRSRAASEDQVNRIMQNLQPSFLGASPKASEGAPIIGPDNVVESGNGRSIALARAYQQGHENADKYKRWLSENAEQFGLDTGTIGKMKQPVLVRVRTSGVDREAFVKEANENAVAVMSASEQAQSDAKQMSDRLMSLFHPDETGNLDAASNRTFLRAFLSDVAGPSDRGRLLTADGSLSQEGVTRVRNAIFAKAYENPDLLAKVTESTDSNIRNIGTALLVAAPHFAAMKDGIAKGQLFDLDISGELGEAARKLSVLKDSKDSVEDYLAQQALFGEEMSPLSKDLLRTLDAYARKPKQLGQLLTTYTEMVESAGSPNQGGFFGQSAPTKAELLEASLRKMNSDEQDEATPALFGTGTRG